MSIYKPQPSKLSTLSITNPNYWTLCVSRSQYTEQDIVASLVDIETVNDEFHTLQEQIWTNILVDDNGEMNSLTGYASETHEKIHQFITEASYIYPYFSENSHKNCFPVSKWNKDISSLRAKIAKIQKLVNKVVK